MLELIKAARSRAAWVLAIASGLFVLGGAPASAGVWMRAICQNPNGTPAPVDGLVFSGENVGAQGGASGGSSCPGGLTGLPSGALKPTGVWVMVTADANVPTDATWTYSAPAGSTIAGGSITGVSVEQLTWGASMDDHDAWISSPGDDASGGDLIADCATPSAPSSGIPGSAPCDVDPEEQSLGPAAPAVPLVAAIDHPGGSALYMSAGCSTVDTDPCDYNAASFANLSFSGGFQWADVLLSDATMPTASSFGGSLLAAGAVHGTAQLTFAAADAAGPGVYQVIVKIDGHAVYQATPNTNGGECVPAGTDATSGALIFDYQQPCPQAVDLDIPVDTTALRDGEHQVQVIVQDAAQNSSTVLDQQIDVDNFATVAGTSSESTVTTPTPTTPTPTTPTPTTPTPTTPTTPAPAAPPAVSYAFRLDPATAVLTSSIVRSRYQRSSMTLSGEVLAAGAPAPDVTVTVQAATLAGGAYVTLAQTNTDASGRFTVSVPRGDSRALRLTVGANDVAFQQLVTPDVSMSVRSLAGARIAFTGRVAIDTTAGPLPLVEIEAYDPTGPVHWQVIATTTVARDGRYRYLYEASPQVANYKFKFRALTPALSGYWQAAISPVKEAKVKG